jgi:hypothetical protein
MPLPAKNKPPIAPLKEQLAVLFRVDNPVTVTAVLNHEINNHFTNQFYLYIIKLILNEPDGVAINNNRLTIAKRIIREIVLLKIGNDIFNFGVFWQVRSKMRCHMKIYQF